MLIKDRGVTKEVSKKDFERKYKRLGYKKVEAKENELSDMTRSELYELAQLNEVEGRSEMSKAELLEALKEVG